MNNYAKKIKFVDIYNHDYNKQPFFGINKNENSQFNLVKNNYNDKEKILVTLKDNLDPRNYNLNYYDSIKRTLLREHT